MVLMNEIKKFLLSILNSFRSWKVVLISIAVGVSLFLIVIAYSYFSGGNLAVVGSPSAIINIIPGPTATIWIPTEVPLPTQTPTPSIRPSPLPGVIGIDTLVQIFGTEGSGLNIRSVSGLDSEVEFLAYDTEVFSIEDGPIEVDGIVWWYLVTPVNEERAGWAAANYLSLVSQP